MPQPQPAAKQTITGLTPEQLKSLDNLIGGSASVAAFISMEGDKKNPMPYGFSKELVMLRACELATQASISKKPDGTPANRDSVHGDTLMSYWMWRLKENGITPTVEAAKELGGVVIQAAADQRAKGEEAIQRGEKPVYYAQAKAKLTVIMANGEEGTKEIVVGSDDAFMAGLTALVNTTAVREAQKCDAPEFTKQQILDGTKRVYAKPDHSDVSIPEAYNLGQELGEFKVQQILPNRVKVKGDLTP